MHKGTSRKKKLRKKASRTETSRVLAPKKTAKEQAENDRLLGTILSDRFCLDMKQRIDPIRDSYPASCPKRCKASVSRTLSWHIRKQYQRHGLATESRLVAEGERYVLRRIRALFCRKDTARKVQTHGGKTRGGSADLNILMTTNRRALSDSIAMMSAGNEDIVPIDGEGDGCLDPETIAGVRHLLDSDTDRHHPKEIAQITALRDDDEWPPIHCK
jgi:hypothetical protein